MTSNRAASQVHLPIIALPEGSQRPSMGRRGGGTPTERKAIQDVLLGEGLIALRLSTDVQSMEELQEAMVKHLGQNSAETRRRYAQSVVRWFFPDGFDGLLRRTWIAYKEEAIARDLLHYLYLSGEPIMGRCVAEALFPLENGIAIPPDFFDRFLHEHLGESVPAKTRERLKSNLKRLGFLERVRGKPDRLEPVGSQNTSFLLLLHYRFASKAVRSIELKTLLADPFWKYLGYKSEDAVRSILRDADARGMIGKYVVADQLEQVTTRFTFDELLERRLRL